MIDIHNPAGRLYEILRHAKSQHDSQTVRSVWAEVLEEDENDDSAITRKVIEVYQLSEDVKKLIEMNENINKELYLSSFSLIEQAIFPLNLNTSWQSSKAKLNDTVMTRLQFSSELLSSFYTETKIKKEDLEKITTLVNELFDFIQESSLETSFRLALLEELDKIRKAISMYKIVGAKGVKQALQSSIGMVVANKEELTNSSKKNPDVIQRLGKLLDKIDSFTSTALKAHKILSKPVNYLIELIQTGEEEEPVEVDRS